MWSNECRRMRGFQRSTYQPHPMSIDWVLGNKLLEIQSCTPPQDNGNAKYWYLRDGLVALAWYCRTECNGTSPTLTRLIVTEISWHKVLRWWYRTGGLYGLEEHDTLCLLLHLYNTMWITISNEESNITQKYPCHGAALKAARPLWNYMVIFLRRRWARRQSRSNPRGREGAR